MWKRIKEINEDTLLLPLCTCIFGQEYGKRKDDGVK